MTPPRSRPGPRPAARTPAARLPAARTASRTDDRTAHHLEPRP